jgi:hypothetical protein
MNATFLETTQPSYFELHEEQYFTPALRKSDTKQYFTLEKIKFFRQASDFSLQIAVPFFNSY